MPGPASHNTLDDGILEKSKASSQELLSYEDPSSIKSPEVREASITPSGLAQSENVPETSIPEKYKHHHVPEKDEHPNPNSDSTLFRPVAHIGAFGVYSTLGSMITKTAPVQGPLLQASRPEFGISQILNESCGDPVVPTRCGYGCCVFPGKAVPQSSLLGPEFISYQEFPCFTNQDLAALATDLTNISWIKSGLRDQALNNVKPGAQLGKF